MRHQFVRSLAGSRDPNFKNVTLLLHGDGTNGAQNNTFLDSGPNNLAVTMAGGVAQGSFSPYGDRWSNYFDGTGDYLSRAFTSTTDGMYPQGTTYTIEAWIFPTTSTGLRMIYDCSATNTNNFGEATLFINGTTVGYGFRPTTGGTYVSISGGTALINNWNHIAVSVQSGSARFFLNGTQVGSTITISAASFTPVGAAIGRLANGYITGVVDYTGYISNVRLVQSTALYTSNFTPSTAPLTAITNTSLLTCQSNRFRDASTNNFTITRNGDVSVQRFSPFSPDAEYRTDIIAGSGYFPGTNNNRLSVSSSTVDIGRNAFTVESWVYYGGGGIRTWYGPAGATPFHVNGTTLRVYYETGFLQAGPIEINAWTHIAVTRDFSNVLRVFVNGVLHSSVTTATAYSTTTPVIGDRTGLGQPFFGYIAGFRLLIHTALYTSNFTPPTSPPTVINDTRWLVNFNNAGIRDNAMINNLETVGNAQISTSVKKYGTGALYFDGNGDYLAIARLENGLNIRTESFTIEGWFYVTNSIFLALFSSGNTGLGNFYFDTSGLTVYLGDGATNNITFPTSNIPVNSWFHLAVSFDTTTYRVFINGTLVGSSTTLLKNVVLTDFYIAARPGQFNKIMVAGYIDDFRITKGVARYTSDFTPPTAPFPDF